jgi:hypothetical protein
MRAKKTQQIAEILQSPGDADRGYLAREFVVCGLPMRDPHEPKYTRRNGRDTLTLTSGTDNRGDFIGLPYGSIPRLLLYWFVSEAIRTQSRHLSLGSTANGFLRTIGLDPGTGRGKRGDVTRLREQWRRLVGCRISFSRQEGDAIKGSEKTLDMLVSEQSETWWDFSKADSEPNSDTGQQGLFDGSVMLSEVFYQAITRSPVPFDFRALCALKSSPFAIDLYIWLTWRVFALGKAPIKNTQGRSAIVPLSELADQIGSTYTRERDFKEALSEGLEAVKQIWPQLDYTLTTKHLILRPGPVPISSVPKLQRSRQLGEVKPGELSAHTDVWFRTTYPNHSLTAVKKGYRAFLAKNGITPHHIDAHFKDYAQKWVKSEL